MSTTTTIDSPATQPKEKKAETRGRKPGTKPVPVQKEMEGQVGMVMSRNQAFIDNQIQPYNMAAECLNSIAKELQRIGVPPPQSMAVYSNECFIDIEKFVRRRLVEINKIEINTTLKLSTERIADLIEKPDTSNIELLVKRLQRIKDINLNWIEIVGGVAKVSQGYIDQIEAGATTRAASKTQANAFAMCQKVADAANAVQEQFCPDVFSMHVFNHVQGMIVWDQGKYVPNLHSITFL